MTSAPSGGDLPVDAAIGRYQSALLDLLHEGTDGDDMAEQLVRLAGELGVDLGPVDAALLEVAADLTRQWSRRA